MEVKIDNGKLIIIIDLQEPTPSASGKTLVVATTHGNVTTDCLIDGKPVVVGLNAYIKK
jgi:outer membrane lipoprotein SlyB